MTTHMQQLTNLWWRRGNNSAATNSKQQSTNVQHAQRRTKDDGMMRWWTTADEVEDVGGWRDRVDGWWQRGYNGADNNYKKQQSTNEQQQRQMMTTAGKKCCAVVEVVDIGGWGGGQWQLKRHSGRLMAEGPQQRWRQLQKTTINNWAAAEAEDNDGWQEARCGGGDGGVRTVVWWRRLHGKVMEAGAGRMGRRDVHYFFFSWRGRILPQSYPLQSCIKIGEIFLISGVLFVTIGGRIRIGTILWSY